MVLPLTVTTFLPLRVMHRGNLNSGGLKGIYAREFDGQTGITMLKETETLTV
ncbi:MAG: hypothetical protein ACE5GD_05005 [Candidatus Geothermarchaeales archaeon]